MYHDVVAELTALHFFALLMIKENGNFIFNFAFDDFKFAIFICFAIDRNIYKHSPRGVAVTAKGDTIEEAYQLCEKLLKENIKGEDLWHRRDIGTEELLEKISYDFY